MEKLTEVFRSGYVSLIGKPNVGKSTLLNKLVQQKIAAMSSRPQTTRNKILGVCHLAKGQIILLDTPGIHQGKNRLNQAMVKSAMATFQDVDLVAFMLSATDGLGDADLSVLESLTKARVKKILVINKIDLVPKPKLLSLIEHLNKKGDFLSIVPVSARFDDGLDLLKDLILRELPLGPCYFPTDMITDCSEEFLIREIIREKAIRITHLEIPHVVAVVLDRLYEGKAGKTVIEATLYVEKNSQKKILVGENGQRIKEIGTHARQEIEKRFALNVYLSLFVKVKTRWRDSVRDLKELGYLNGPHQK